MTAAKRVEVTLVRAWSPSEPQDDAGHRIVFTMILDAHGAPDATAWLADPAIWMARRDSPGMATETGDVMHDEDGWSLRFAADAAQVTDAPPHRILGGAGWLRPGEVVTIREANGAKAAWRVVGVA